MGVAKWRFLRWMCGGHIRKDKIQKGSIQGDIGVTLIEETAIEDRLRRFGHVQRRSMERSVKRLHGF